MQLDISPGYLRKISTRSWRKKLLSSLQEMQRFLHRPSWSDPRSFLLLPKNTALIRDIMQRTRRVRRTRPQHLLVVGIGGSILGARAVAEALQGPPEWRVQDRPRFWWLETVESEQLRTIKTMLSRVASPDDLTVVLSSKSGSTLETMTNASVLLGAFRSRWLRRQPRVFVATEKKSPLMRIAEREQWEQFIVPTGVGGRFSVLSAVGLVPLALAGIDINELCRGARQSLKACFSQGARNPALRSALILLKASRACGIHDTFVFRPQLEALAQWYRQLQGESLGKPFQRKGTTWMTPTTSVGSQDLHSVLQLYLTDARNRMTTFLFAPARGPAVPGGPLRSLAGIPRSHEVGEVQEALFNSVLRTYRAGRQPFLQAVFGGLTPAALGAFLQWKMIETVLIADVLGVNAYDQPAVERYKARARALLKR